MTRRPDRVLAFCHACGRALPAKIYIERLAQRLGVPVADFFRESAPRGALSRARPVVSAVYPYQNFRGEVVYEKVRYDPKDFRLRVPDPTRRSGYRYRLGDVERVLYRLPDLIDVTSVVVVEGEKAADRLWALGLAATCAPQGAGFWLESFCHQLWVAGVLDVIILPDGDGAGRRHARAIAAACARFTPRLPADIEADHPLALLPDTADAMGRLSVKVITIESLASHGDIVDWLDAGGTLTELRALIGAAPRLLTTPEEKVERRRELNRLRQRRHYDRHKRKAKGRSADE